MKKIWQWRRWEVFLYKKDWFSISKKIALDDTKKASLKKEIQILSKLNSEWLDFVPFLINYWDNFFEYYYIEWNSFNKVFRNSSINNKKFLINSLLKKILLLDNLWVVHWELIRPYSNVLVDKNLNINIIDFERWKLWDFSWKNLRSFSQWLKNEWYLSILDLIEIWKLNSPNQIYKFIYNKINKFTFWKSLTLFSIIFILLAIDLFTKYVFYNLSYLNWHYIFLKAFNEWISFGININFYVIISITLFSLILFIYSYKKNRISGIILILLLSGSIWNFFDRIIYWWVRDFISIYSFPIFNLADVYLTFAVIILIYNEFLKTN